ncbi:MAG: M20/M25/M40 family metallo-hydrolase [Bacteriovoracia bacterium]
MHVLSAIIIILSSVSAWSEELFLKTADKTYLVNETDLQLISEEQHQRNRGCGGFIVTDSPLPKSTPVINELAYSINRPQLVNEAMGHVTEEKLLSFIEDFSAYHTRYYTSPSGVKALEDLATRWKNMTQHRQDITVTALYHNKWPQPSVILTIKGQTSANIVLGGHADSINTDDEGNHSHAPGADDNASGISTLTEIIRVLTQMNYAPRNTIHFMAYAAEEVGLRGSMEIADKYASQNKKVLGVMQFDGTNYNGSQIKIALIKDNTDKKQNAFLGSLIDTYLQVPWSYDQCHYACSDHYSWTYKGFVASFAGESKVKEENPFIHTALDTLAASNHTASHAALFTKLGLAYVIELDK